MTLKKLPRVVFSRRIVSLNAAEITTRTTNGKANRTARKVYQINLGRKTTTTTTTTTTTYESSTTAGTRVSKRPLQIEVKDARELIVCSSKKKTLFPKIICNMTSMYLKNRQRTNKRWKKKSTTLNHKQKSQYPR